MVAYEPRIPIDGERIAAFCRKWRITEFALFGSVLREDFRPNSDVDVLVTFADDAHWSLLDLIDVRDDLQGIFGRHIDLVEKDAIRNPFRRRSILDSQKILYAA